MSPQWDVTLYIITWQCVGVFDKKRRVMVVLSYLLFVVFIYFSVAGPGCLSLTVSVACVLSAGSTCPVLLCLLWPCSSCVLIVTQSNTAGTSCWVDCVACCSWGRQAVHAVQQCSIVCNLPASMDVTLCKIRKINHFLLPVLIGNLLKQSLGNLSLLFSS